MVLFSLSISSFIINIYAQTKGGGVTSGEAIGGEATAIGIAGGFYNNCNQCTIIIAPQATGGAATSGLATGGAAIGPGATGRATS